MIRKTLIVSRGFEAEDGTAVITQSFRPVARPPARASGPAPAQRRVSDRDVWAIAVVVFGVLERLLDPKTFHSVWLEMWWAIETVTTVGYGDIVPSQTAGKVIAGFLMLGGLSLLSVVTAAITSGFVSRAEIRRRTTGEDPIMQKLDQLASELQAVKTQLEHGRPSRTAPADSTTGHPEGPPTTSSVTNA